jgi:hypothetical protein
MPGLPVERFVKAIEKKTDFRLVVHASDCKDERKLVVGPLVPRLKLA